MSNGENTFDVYQDQLAFPQSGVAKATRESIFEQIAAAGVAFGKEMKAASSRCTGWQNGGIEEPWVGPNSTLERACVFQFELSTK
jgi:hypothetical protein